jgi:hypothetical protein
MKTALAVLLAGLLAATFVLPCLADSSHSHPEFYFTRLINPAGRAAFFPTPDAHVFRTIFDVDNVMPISNVDTACNGGKAV